MIFTDLNAIDMLEQSNYIEKEYDVEALEDAFKAWKYILKFDSIDPRVIKDTHSILMKSRNLEKKYKGDFRDIPVWIGGVKKDQPKIVIDSLIRDWCEKTKDLSLDPIDLHVEFEGIHPFVDGNGRIGRILLNWTTVKRSNELVIFTEDNKHEYYMLFDSYKKAYEKRASELWKSLTDRM